MSDNNKIAADLVGAYVSNNTVPIAELTALLKSTLAILNGSAPVEAEAVIATEEKPFAKVSVKKSVTPDY
jgi:predicted transcriptional regulator